MLVMLAAPIIEKLVRQSFLIFLDKVPLELMESRLYIHFHFKIILEMVILELSVRVRY
jgi:hypothetical protein